MPREDRLAKQGSIHLRILFVTSDKFPPFRPAAKAIFGEGLAADGHVIDWIAQAADSSSRAGAQPYKTGVAHVAPTNDGRGRLARLRKHWAAFRNDWAVFRLLRTREYDLVQIKDKYVGALIVIAAAKLYKVPVFHWLAYPHGEASLYAARQGVARYSFWYWIRGVVQKWLLYRIIMPASAHVFVQSEQMRVDIAREGIAPSLMTAVPSSINLATIDALPKRRVPPGQGAPRIVYLGTLLRERQLDFLIRTLVLVRLRLPDAELWLVGKGEMREDEDLLRREAERLGVGGAVRITGWLPAHTAWEHVGHAAVCVSPYFPTPILRSTSPTKLVEYMALGKAVVASEHPEQSEVLVRSGAGLVCPWNESEFADSIVSLLIHPGLAAAMGRAGRRFVEENRTHVAMVNRVAAQYRQTLQSVGKPLEPGVAVGRMESSRF